MQVTECFNQQFKSLYLNEYPCVNEFSKSDEVEKLIDLIRDKKSPWYEVIEWSKDGVLIRETFIKNATSINPIIKLHFTHLRLNDMKITSIDPAVCEFVNLEELILTCNELNECDSTNLPDSLKILDLTGNYLKSLNKLKKRALYKLEHLGLAYNWIEDTNRCFSSTSWRSLYSLDLSYNQLHNLVDLLDSLADLNKLKVLMLYGNPLVLLPGYRGFVIDSLPNLFALDDKVISKEERINSQEFKLFANEINKECEMRVVFYYINNLVIPEQPEIDEAPEVFIYKYFVKFHSIEDCENEEESFSSEHKFHSLITYNNKIWAKIKSYRQKAEMTEEMEPSENIDFNEKGILKLKYKSLRQLRDFFLDGTEIEIVERKINYRSKDYVPDTSSDLKKSKVKQSTKEEKKEDPNKAKNKKKKPQSSMLDTYDQVSCEDKSLAKFRLELHSLLDGINKEVRQVFTAKIRNEQTHADLNDSRKDAENKKKKESRKSADAKKKIQPELEVAIAEIPPLELDMKLSILDFNNFKEIKNHFQSSE